MQESNANACPIRSYKKAQGKLTKRIKVPTSGEKVRPQRMPDDTEITGRGPFLESALQRMNEEQIRKEIDKSRSFR